ncbi:MAG: LysR family transcriptional regulator [Bdellovibrionota bacterium]
MKIEDLKILDAVFQEPNLTRVAERFHVSQSSLSKIIRRIETDFGFALFERKGFHGLRPTAQGALFAERIGRFTRSWDDTLALVRSFDHRKIDIKVTGPKLYMRNVFLQRWFASALPEKFRLTYVESRIDHISLTALSSDVDLVITPSPVELLDWIPTPVFTETFAVFSAARSAQSISDLDIKNRQWVAYHAANDMIHSFFHENQISPEQIIAYVEDVESILDIVQSNPKVLSLLPSHAANQHRRIKNFAWPKSRGQTLHLAYRKDNPSAQEPARELKKLLL